MFKHIPFPFVLLATTAATMLAAEPDFTTLESQFRELPMAAKRLTGPLYWLHGTETKSELEAELDRVAEGGNGCFTAEARPHNDWLGAGWYRDLDICLAAAKKHDLQMWIFDDYWWPSQMMGGRVPAAYGSKCLVASATTVTGPANHRASGCSGEKFIAVVAGKELPDGSVDGATLLDLTGSIREGNLDWAAPAGTWKVMTFSWEFKGPHGKQQKFIAVDGASPDCVDWFIQTVYQPHYDRYKEDFGKTIRGYFYDEPETPGDWGSDLPKWMAEHGVDLKKALVAHMFKLAGDEQVAGKYQFLNSFAESWGRTMYGGMTKWCREHNVASIGHFMEHDFFDQAFNAGNVMQLMKYSEIGGMDLVCQQLYPGQRTESIYQTPKFASSVSHLYARESNNDVAFCEIFGAYGQKVTYPEMKWLADWHQVRGVNFMIPHSFNPKAPLDTDCPPYFYNGGFEPRWPLYKIWADYSSRLSLMLTGGRHVCPVAFVHVGQSTHVGRSLRPENMTSALQDALFDCDWLPYDAWESLAKVEGKTIRLRQEAYRVLVLPAAEVIPWQTLAKAKEFLDAGGVVVGYGIQPALSATLGKTTADIAALRTAIWGADAKPGTAACQTTPAGGRSYWLPEKPTAEQIQSALTGDAGIHPMVEVLDGKTDNWLHVLHRNKSGRDVFLICNQDHLGAVKNFRLRVTAAGIPECWDPMRNEIRAISHVRNGDSVELNLSLQPSESVLLVFQASDRGLPLRDAANGTPLREIAVRDTRPPSSQPAATKMTVVSATYGIPGDPQRSLDVRARLQRLIDNGERQLLVSDLAKRPGKDPAYGVVKTLNAVCSAGGRSIVLTGKDPETIALSDAPPSPRQAALLRLAAGKRYTSIPLEADPFSGIGTLPADVNLATSRVYLELDAISPEEAATITVNGKAAGGFIGRPFRLEVTHLLNPGDNRIEIAPFAPKSAKLRVFAK